MEHLLLFSILAILSDATLYRKISHRTRTATSSRVSALLASVIDTCRQRGHSPWLYLQTAIADRRAGQPLAALPR